MKTRTINLRGVPEELAVKAKMAAAIQGVTLKDFILHSMEKAIEQMHLQAASMSLFGLPSGVRSETKSKSRRKK